jgi:tetratricopeptide (TPR) repeat protein
MARALDAAVDVEIGDDHFKHKNYRGALFRYEDAAQNKPRDVAIQVRLGRACEKLNDNARAIEYYKEAEKVGTTGLWAEEAHTATQRLQQQASTSR